jgi:hypothetical protein
MNKLNDPLMQIIIFFDVNENDDNYLNTTEQN